MTEEVEEKLYSGVVYRYTLNADGKQKGWSYVGETDNETGRRMNWAKDVKSSSYAGGKIDRARKIYGNDTETTWTYTVEEVVKANTPEELKAKLREREKFFVAKYDSFEHGFNSNQGGTGQSGKKLSEAERKQNGDNRRGKPQSQATKDQISEKMKGHPVSDETREKIRLGNTGKKRSDEQRKAQSERMKGRSMSEEARRKSSESHRGKRPIISEQGKANLAAAHEKTKKAVLVEWEDGRSKVYPSLTEAAEALHKKPGSIHYAIGHGNLTKDGWKASYIK